MRTERLPVESVNHRKNETSPKVSNQYSLKKMGNRFLISTYLIRARLQSTFKIVTRSDYSKKTLFRKIHNQETYLYKSSLACKTIRKNA
ncbi:hypothetical protein SPPR111872_12755 [Sphingobacterium prati]